MTVLTRMLGRIGASERPIIYLIGPCGNPNFGDEFIARTWIRHLAREHPNAQVVLDCHTPGSAAVLLGGEHPHLTVVDTVWRIAVALRDAPINRAAQHMRATVVNRLFLIQSAFRLSASWPEWMSDRKM